jgi:hypothetical protein
MLRVCYVLTNSGNSSTTVSFESNMLVEGAILDVSPCADISRQLLPLCVPHVNSIPAKVGLILLESAVNHNQVWSVARFPEVRRVDRDRTSESPRIPPEPIIFEIYWVSVS